MVTQTRFKVRDSIDRVVFEICDEVCIHRNEDGRERQVDPRKIYHPTTASIINFHLELVYWGTGLNGEKITRYRVHGGDIVRLVEKVGALETKWWELYQTRREECGREPLDDEDDGCC